MGKSSRKSQLLPHAPSRTCRGGRLRLAFHGFTVHVIILLRPFHRRCHPMERSPRNVHELLAVRQLKRNGLGLQLPAHLIQVFAFFFQKPRTPGLGPCRRTKEHPPQDVHDIPVVGKLRLHVIRRIVNRDHELIRYFVHFLFLVFCLTVLATMAMLPCLSMKRASQIRKNWKIILFND